MNELKNKEEKSKSSADAKDKVEEEGDILNESILKYIDKRELVWPELIRLILKTQKNFDFYPLDESINAICDKLANCTPETYSS